MKKKFFKKGVEGPSWTIVVWIILIVLLVIVLMFVFGFFRPNLSKLGEYADSVFPGLQKIDLFGGEKTDKEGDAVNEKSPEELFKDARGCEDYKKINPSKIKDQTSKDKLNSDLFECYIKENDCEHAKNIFDRQEIKNSIIKDSELLKLIKCYFLKTFNKNDNSIMELLGKLSDDTKKQEAIRFFNDMNKVKTDLESYKTAVGVIIFKSSETENINEAKRLLGEIKNNEIENAAAFWLAKEKGNCIFATKVDKKLKFPIIGIYGAHGDEEIRLWSIYEMLNCILSKERRDTTYRVDNTEIISFLNDYSNEKDNIILVDDIIENYNAPFRCNNVRYNLFSNQEECNTFNKDLNINKVGSDRYRKMRCHFIDPVFFSLGRCSSCLDVDSCKKYDYVEVCKANPCGIEGGCKDIGLVFLNCVPVATK